LGKPIIRRCIGDIVNEKNKLGYLAIADVKKGKSVIREKPEEASVRKRQFSAKNGTETDELIKGRTEKFRRYCTVRVWYTFF
jgi:hypothetical protein